jgi:hypothetical protein
MAYEDVAKLARDPDFSARLGASVATEARGKSDPLSDKVLGMIDMGATMFMPAVASSPGFDTKYASGGQEMITDGDLLSAVQASWDRVAGIVIPATP